jgi:NRAMP (natural resistance-associated macrophage protein)-like metal ion transporter
MLRQTRARRRPPIVGRHPHERLRGLRARRVGALTALFAVLGPGILAGLSDDDPPGITTYSVLGADHGYELLWVLALSTAALIVFHEIAVRTGIVTGRGMVALMRDERGRLATRIVVGALVIANLGTLCAEFAGLAAGAHLLTGVPRGFAVPIGAVAVAGLVLRSSFHRVEHILLALSAVFVAYILAGFLAGPDWGAAAEGLAVPRVPAGRDAMLLIVATVGTTLAPWGLAFIQSYAVDKKLRPSELGYERIDVVAGAVMTGVIGLFVVVACAATLNVTGTEISDAADAASALEPLAGKLAGDLFGFGFLGAALLAIAIVPLSTAYSVAEGARRPADLDLGVREAPVFYGAYSAMMVLAASIVLIPAVPIVPLLYLSQALNAVLLLAILPFIRGLARDPDLMGEHRLGPAASVASLVVIACVAASVVVLAALTLS